MAQTPERTHDKPAPGGAEKKVWLGPNVAASHSPEDGAQECFSLSDIKAILSSTTQPVTSGRKPLFRR